MDSKDLHDFHNEMGVLLRKYGYRGYVGMIFSANGAPYVSKIYPPVGEIRVAALMVETRLAEWLSDAKQVTISKHEGGIITPSAKKN